jgi:hypothetical protein
VTSDDTLLTGCTQTRTEIRHPTRFESKQSRSARGVGDDKTDAGNRFRHTDGQVRQAATALELDQDYLVLFFVFCSGDMYGKRG